MAQCKHCGSKYVNVKVVKGISKVIKAVCKECLMVTYIHDERGVL